MGGNYSQSECIFLFFENQPMKAYVALTFYNPSKSQAHPQELAAPGEAGCLVRHCIPENCVHYFLPCPPLCSSSTPSPPCLSIPLLSFPFFSMLYIGFADFLIPSSLRLPGDSGFVAQWFSTLASYWKKLNKY